MAWKNGVWDIHKDAHKLKMFSEFLENDEQTGT